MLRVLTLNIWNLSGPWRDRRNEIVTWLGHLDADLVCLQEIVDDGERCTARWLADAAGYAHVVWGGVEARPGMTFGPAIMSRWPIDSHATYPLPNDPGPTDIERVLLHARTRGVDVFTTHLTSLYPSGRLRELQCVAIDDLVRQHSAADAALPPILAGDFNAEPDSTEIRFLCGLASIDGKSTYWQDAWRVAGGREPGWTWDNRNPFAAAEHEPDRRIDYVFSGWRRDGGAGCVESCRVVCDRSFSGTFPTDHFGVLAEIRE